MTLSRRVRPAFTLVEILVVVVILGILAAIVVPRFARANEDPTYQVAKSLERALETASLFAMYSGERVDRPDDFSYFVGSGRGGINDQRPEAVVLDNRIRSLLLDPEATLVGSNTITLTFKTGLVATYELNNGEITATYTGPGAP